MDIKNIQTIVVVMMENRSFDHILGHLSLPPYANGTKVDGLRNPTTDPAYSNEYEAEPYYPFHLKDGVLPCDLPHERELVATQLDDDGTTFNMDGFVQAYYESTSVNRTQTPETLGYFTPAEVPITSFLANNYGVCDRWFAPLPASTQPNRLMALSGESRIDHTTGIFPDHGPLVLDWLKARNVRWRVYHAGVSFFLLLGRFEDVLSDNFRDFSELAKDVATEGDDTFPEFIWIEPSFADAPHIGSDHPNDNHPPLPIGFGEQFLRDVYTALTRNPARFGKTLLIVTYDEHGGFYDHVQPLRIPYDPRPNATYPAFASTGVRVPAILVSPFVSPRSVYSQPADHTSILQLLAERFAPNEAGYSSAVNLRRDAGITSVSRMLNLGSPRATIPSMPTPAITAQAILGGQKLAPTPGEAAFTQAAQELMKRFPVDAQAKFPELWHALQ